MQTLRCRQSPLVHVHPSAVSIPRILLPTDPDTRDDPEDQRWHRDDRDDDEIVLAVEHPQ